MPPQDEKPVQHSALSKNQVAVLKRLVTEGDFRTQFFKNPHDAVSKAGVALPSKEIAVLSAITPAQIDAMQSLISGPARVAADGTNTALHALAYAVIVALLLAMPNPMDVSALAKRNI